MLPFDYQNSTRIIYGHEQYLSIGKILAEKYSRILLHYGGGSIKKSGLYDKIKKSLDDAGIDYCELGGVRPNPDIKLVRQGIKLCRREGVELVLAVGGGSVIDSAKAIALGSTAEDDIWDIFMNKLPLTNPPLPNACVLTLPAAGSENSPNSVISNIETERKLGYGNLLLRPEISFICPELFLTLPYNQLANGACDMLCHIQERYFTDTKNTELSDALGEATMKTILEQALILAKDIKNVDAWGQLALAGIIAHNNILGIGRKQSWACHAMEHELSATYDIAHGAGLAVLVPPYLEYVWQKSPRCVLQWAHRVMEIPDSGDAARDIAAGIEAQRAWYAKLGLPSCMEELGIDIESAAWDQLAAKAIAVSGGKLSGIKELDAADIVAIYKAACKG